MDGLQLFFVVSEESQGDFSQVTLSELMEAEEKFKKEGAVKMVEKLG